LARVKAITQLTARISSATCQKHAIRPMKNTSRMKPFSQGFSRNTGATRGKAKNAPTPKATSTMSIIVTWRIGCEKNGSTSRSGCTIKPCPERFEFCAV
jgi:hypothetical protein